MFWFVFSLNQGDIQACVYLCEPFSDLFSIDSGWAPGTKASRREQGVAGVGVGFRLQNLAFHSATPLLMGPM